ncbi:uncharacterized protein FFB20_10994 [Fusarium fujikuroi]|nr:uncharacterized protein FFB20_10994 [Fusarium fujikuroi]SCO24319.1 uncharacterized protein FFE2_15925 [Fusarium fujikuroi]SCO25552.1 uncharacterized protein FFC1_15585 [Fusarium fujikuroi]SCO54006.1 uncharacterized protein FFNC_15286 [Fusarium fujikuroi]
MGEGFPSKHKYEGDWIEVEELITTLGGAFSAVRTNNVTDILLVEREVTATTRLRGIVERDRQWAKDRGLELRNPKWLEEIYCQYCFFFKDKPPLEPNVRSIVLEERRYTDEDGYLIVAPRDTLTWRTVQVIDRAMEIRRSSSVVYVKDNKTKDIVPMVISRQGQPYTDEILDYIRVLQTIEVNDKKNLYRCQWLRDCFCYNGHICVVEEKRFESLSTVLQGRPRLNHREIRNLVRQLFESVAFLHKIGIVHTTLSPRNILLRAESLSSEIKIASASTGKNHQGRKPSSQLSTQIQIVGFHCAIFKKVGYYEALTPYCYTAPEVFQGEEWSYACDIWSIGCTIFLLLTGTNFIRETEECEVLDSIYHQAPDSLGEKYSPAATDSFQSIECYKHTLKSIDCPTECSDLLERIFTASEKRITAKEALKHPWLR